MKQGAGRPLVPMARQESEGRELVWNQHEEALRPLVKAGKLGMVPSWFRKNRANCDY